MYLDEMTIELAVLRDIIKGGAKSIYTDFVTPAVVDACLNRRDSRVSISEICDLRT